MWHVDDLKISHIDPKVVGDVIKQMYQRYVKEDPITVTRVIVHDYLGITIYFSKEDEVMIRMDDYVAEIL